MMRASLLVCAACVAFGLAQDPRSSDPAQVLLDADRRFAAGVAERGTPAWVEAFAPDGVQLVAGVGEVPRERMAALMEPALGAGGGALAWEPLRARASGDLGYTVGRYASRGFQPDGAEQVEEGLYVTIWRRQADGTWKAELDTGVPVATKPAGPR